MIYDCFRLVTWSTGIMVLKCLRDRERDRDRDRDPDKCYSMYKAYQSQYKSNRAEQKERMTNRDIGTIELKAINNDGHGDINT